MMTADGCGAYRAFDGSDGRNDIANRVAFIEKTPKIRIRDYSMAVHRDWNEEGTLLNERRQWEDFLNWMERDWKGDGPQDQESRDWCDRVLVALEYELEN